MTQVEDIMSDIEIEELSNSMKSELENCGLSDVVYDSSSEFCLIPRIHENIRAMDRYSYEPIILSIGPYHNGSQELSCTEKEKWNRLDYILKLNCEKGLKDYLTIIKGLEKRARMCYHGDIKMNKRKFLQTLLLDGCFVLVSLGNEFITSGAQRGQCLYQDNAQQTGQWYNVFVTHDLLLLENQIPFFIVEGIYEAVISNKMAPTTCTESVAQHIELSVQFYPISIRESSRPKKFDHLLHLCHMYFRPSSYQDEYHDHTAQHYIHVFMEAANLGLTQDGQSPDRWRRATQYHEAGIEFRRRTYFTHNPHSLLDIKLRDCVLEIPFLYVDEQTFVLFRNFIALEQTCSQVGNDVTAYIIFMAKLMSMPDDVALLARKGILGHHMRTDRVVSQLFNSLTKGVVFDFYGNYYLKHLCLALEAYYQNRLHRWVAWLRHNHLSNPWLVVAAVAGVIVLFCTIAQTVLTVESYVNP
jgi:hypothetical protein